MDIGFNVGLTIVVAISVSRLPPPRSSSAKSGYIIDDRQRLQSYLPSRLMVNKGECPFLLLSPLPETNYVWSPPRRTLPR